MSVATKRALPIRMIEAPVAQQSRRAGVRRARMTGHWIGSSSSYVAAIQRREPADVECARAVRCPSPDSARARRRSSCGDANSKPRAKPMRCATSQMIHQSGLASPGSGRNARWREMRRSEFVTVPSFSPHAGGRQQHVREGVRIGALRRNPTRRPARNAAALRFTLSASGRLTTGLVAMIHTALIAPSWIASNRSTAFRPGRSAMRGLFQNCCTVLPMLGVRPDPCAPPACSRGRRLRARPSRSAGR